VLEPIADDETPPFGQRYLTAVVLAARAARPAAPLVLVGHAAAGPLLPGVGRALRDAAYHVGGYVFLDAGLPGPGRPNRLDLLRRENGEQAVVLEAQLALGANYPDREFPGVATRPRGREFFEEPLPTSDDWPNAPCGYLRTSSDRESAARQARSRGWPVVETAVDDWVAWLADPDGVARALLTLVERL
jgi:hypothetical protein